MKPLSKREQTLVEQLRNIIASAPKREPDYPKYGDSEDLENWGQEMGAWGQAERAKHALRAARIPMKVRGY